MRKTLVALLTILFIASLPMQSYAAKGEGKGPSERAYERASDNASFKRESGKTGKAEHRHDSDSDHGHDDDDKDSGSDGRKSWKKDDDDKGDSDSNVKSSKKDGDDKGDSDSDVKSRGKKDRKEKKNKK